METLLENNSMRETECVSFVAASAESRSGSQRQSASENNESQIITRSLECLINAQLCPGNTKNEQSAKGSTEEQKGVAEAAQENKMNRVSSADVEQSKEKLETAANIQICTEDAKLNFKSKRYNDDVNEGVDVRIEQCRVAIEPTGLNFKNDGDAANSELLQTTQSRSQSVLNREECCSDGSSARNDKSGECNHEEFVSEERIMSLNVVSNYACTQVQSTSNAPIHSLGDYENIANGVQIDTGSLSSH
ncbi:unnamed protein product [Strongylus vulgaris]|uniref:Uncharacterized protein n=1 Tax=Strongylus vulgaris TaxID=40348 RepID=A0A3P7IT62_STRVU|nr:unnamed protein product [Strongylus vulgaris]